MRALLLFVRGRSEHCQMVIHAQQSSRTAKRWDIYNLVREIGVIGIYQYESPLTRLNQPIQSDNHSLGHLAQQRNRRGNLQDRASPPSGERSRQCYPWKSGDFRAQKEGSVQMEHGVREQDASQKYDKRDA